MSTPEHETDQFLDTIRENDVHMVWVPPEEPEVVHYYYWTPVGVAAQIVTALRLTPEERAWLDRTPTA